MKIRLILAAGTLGVLGSSSAHAEDGGSANRTAPPRLSAQAQLDLLPLGSQAATLGNATNTADNAVAYGVAAMFDYAVTPYLSVGVAPRFIFHVIKNQPQSGDEVDQELDLRARIVGHLAVSHGLELHASLSPGYAIVLTGAEDIANMTGFTIGGALGATYDLSSKLFVGGELGYQRSFTSSDVEFVGQMISLELSYLHIGMSAGSRF